MLVHQIFDVEQVLFAQRGVVREIEAQPVRRNQRACLLHVRPERRAQRGMQKVRRRVIAQDCLPAFFVYNSGHHVSDVKRFARDSLVRRQAGDRSISVVDVGHFRGAFRRQQLSWSPTARADSA